MIQTLLSKRLKISERDINLRAVGCLVSYKTTDGYFWYFVHLNFDNPITYVLKGYEK